jgi:hypothetical protein
MPIAVTRRRIAGRRPMQAALLSAAAATGNGEWIQLTGDVPATVQITGITTATVEVDGSDAVARPADNTHGTSLGTVTADGIINITNPVEWIKARVTVYTSGTINAILMTTGVD